MTILVTGGTGYIGSHTVVELLEGDYDVIVVDNLSASKARVLDRIQRITGRRPLFYQDDLRDTAAIERIFDTHPTISAVLHFAGLKSVDESIRIPLDYYQNNVTGTLNLCQVMAAAGVKRLVFSSSCTVYGPPATVPITEDAPVGAVVNPYGRSKYIIEEILADLHRSDPDWRVVLLRYFNPIGAHESGLIGEDPAGIPNNLVPYIAQVAVGKLPYLRIFGSDYQTRDGTGVRDYIHVVDLALGHLRALELMARAPGFRIYNLGTGQGYSVLEVLATFARVCGRDIPYRIVDRRPGDLAEAYADPGKALAELEWRAERDLEQMCADFWRWQSNNPDGY
jgi:UDP-glucose 4-epimerase